MAAKFDFSTLGSGFEADWPVKAPTPKDGGGFVEQQIMLRFRQLTHDDIEALIARPDWTPKTLPRAYVVGIGKGESLPEGMSFEQFLDMALSTPRMFPAIVNAFAEFNTGVAAKN